MHQMSGPYVVWFISFYIEIGSTWSTLQTFVSLEFAKIFEKNGTSFMAYCITFIRSPSNYWWFISMCMSMGDKVAMKMRGVLNKNLGMECGGVFMVSRIGGGRVGGSRGCI